MQTAEEAMKALQEFDNEVMKSMESVQEPKVTSEEYKLYYVIWNISNYVL